MQKLDVENRVRGFVETCRRHQLKVTPQRVAIYKALIQSRQHPTADMMYQEVREKYPNISFDTVNRTLLTFSEIGVVDVVEGSEIGKDKECEHKRQPNAIIVPFNVDG